MVWQRFVPSWLRQDTTPDRLRLRSVVVVLVLVIVGLIALGTTNRLVNATARVANNHGEVLVATQQVSASFAEADAAAVSVHLAGAEGNREQRRVYEQAMQRATTGLERIARLVGSDEASHTALQNISGRTVEYAGMIESARIASVEGLPGADGTLQQASAVNRQQISPDVQLVADRARQRFADESNANFYLTAIVLLAIALAVLLWAQYSLHKRFRRLVNVPLALASLVVLVLLVLSLNGFATQQRSLDTAEQEAFNAITVSEQLQQNAYRHRALATTSVLTNSPASVELLQIEQEIESRTGLLQQAIDQAGSERERAAATEISTRWGRYLQESDRIQSAVAAGNVQQAEAITQGAANSAFNGFNTTVEAALLDNREQFLDQLDNASGPLNLLQFFILIGSIVAALLAWSGFALRIGEYR